MKYMILINHNQEAREAWAGMSEAERAIGYGAHAALHDDLAESGEMVVAEALADPSQARRVLVGEGRTTIGNGPFAEVKEYLAGFYLVECESVDRAVEHAARIPEAAFGLVEVRPVLVDTGPDM
ncbi:MAG: YciI family protein [Actinobacteria bacterium]|nr:YciI family protein [Actinomycetota bacterium]MBI3686982.1 YciI family protein [Actinomycetota bacterium]